jgi:hypothetical protein
VKLELAPPRSSKLAFMLGRAVSGSCLVLFLVGANLLSGCGSRPSAKTDAGEESAQTGRAPQVLTAFYAAANDADGRRACSYLTADGIRQVVHVSSRPACVRTVSAFAKGNFADADGSLLHVDRVEKGADGFDVEAEVRGRSHGAYSLVESNGALLIDGFKPEKG